MKICRTIIECLSTSKILASAVALLLTLSSSHAAVYVLSGPMDVVQATTNPGNVGNGIGTIAGSYDDVTNLLSYSISWQNLTSPVTNMHFHLGAPGNPGGVELGIPGPWNSPQVAYNVPVPAGNEANLLAGNWYVNVHTQQFGGGEIRGQVNVQVAAVPEPSWFAGLLIPCLGLMIRRRHNR